LSSSIPAGLFAITSRATTGSPRTASSSSRALPRDPSPSTASSRRSHYGKWSLRREKYSLARAYPRALGEEILAESKKIILGKKTLGEEFFAESFFLTLGEVIFKKITFSPSNFFYHQHALIQRIFQI
jgi:hypothetical protein